MPFEQGKFVYINETMCCVSSVLCTIFNSQNILVEGNGGILGDWVGIAIFILFKYSDWVDSTECNEYKSSLNNKEIFKFNPEIEFANQQLSNLLTRGAYCVIQAAWFRCSRRRRLLQKQLLLTCEFNCHVSSSAQFQLRNMMVKKCLQSKQKMSC